MAFDKNLPADNTKLRNGPTNIRANWAAIISAPSSFIPEAMNLINRSSAGTSPTDPAAITSPQKAYTLFSKSDSGGNTQLFGEGPNSGGTRVITQLTGGLSIASNGYTTVQGGLMLQWGTDSFSGTTLNKDVSLPNTFPSAMFMGVATANNGSASTQMVLTVEKDTTSQFKVHRSNTSPSGLSFFWIAIGN